METVTRSLDRLRGIRESREEAMSLYSEEEAGTMAALAREMQTGVRQLSAGCWPLFGSTSAACYGATTMVVTFILNNSW